MITVTVEVRGKSGTVSQTFADGVSAARWVMEFDRKVFGRVIRTISSPADHESYGETINATLEAAYPRSLNRDDSS